jgi:hypothetical protein
MSIHKTRGILYKLAKLLGDLSAASSEKPGKMAKRISRRITGKATGRVFRKIFK